VEFWGWIPLQERNDELTILRISFVIEDWAPAPRSPPSRGRAPQGQAPPV